MNHLKPFPELPFTNTFYTILGFSLTSLLIVPFIRIRTQRQSPAQQEESEFFSQRKDSGDESERAFDKQDMQRS